MKVDDMNDSDSEKISSPEELDQRLVVISSKSWIALVLTCLLVIGAIFWTFFGSIPNTFEDSTIYLNTQGFEVVPSHFAGEIKEIRVILNQEVTTGEILAIVTEKSGSDHPIHASTTGKIVEIFAQKKEGIDKEKPLFLIQKKEGDYAFFSFVPIERGQQLKPGMQVYIKPESVDAQQYGSIIAHIRYVSPYVATQSELNLLLGSSVLIEHLTESQPVLTVVIDPEKDLKTMNGFKWTSGISPTYKISPLTIGNALFVLQSRHPISYVIPIWRVKKVFYEEEEKK